MKNQLIDLNNHLFAQMERLGSEDLSAAALQVEIERSKSMSQVSGNIIANARLALDAEKAKGEGLLRIRPKMIGGES